MMSFNRKLSFYIAETEFGYVVVSRDEDAETVESEPFPYVHQATACADYAARVVIATLRSLDLDADQVSGDY